MLFKMMQNEKRTLRWKISAIPQWAFFCCPGNGQGTWSQQRHRQDLAPLWSHASSALQRQEAVPLQAADGRRPTEAHSEGTIGEAAAAAIPLESDA